jgi:hypothetical protein
VPQVVKSSFWQFSGSLPLATAGKKLFNKTIRKRSMQANLEPEPFVDAVEAAEFLRLRPRRVLELARQGAIPAYPLGEGKRKV